MDWILPPSVGGAVLAALAVAGGAPLFGDGLRTLRLRRAFARLHESPLDPDAFGLVRTIGRVALESPLFGPLSGRPCAGYRLEILAADGRLTTTIEERRPFRLIAARGSAIVAARGARWALPPAAERIVDREHPGTAGVVALIERTPEARWLHRAGAPLRLVERSLAAGAVCRVTGSVRRIRAGEEALEGARLRTGTDDADLWEPAPVAADAPHELVIDDGDFLEYLHVSDPAAGAEPLPSRLHLAGLALGPVLGLTGLLYLAHVADGLRVGWRP